MVMSLETYILRIKEIANNFFNHQFVDLLKEIHNELTSGKDIILIKF